MLLGEDSDILDYLPLIEEQCTQINQLIQLFVGPQGIVGNNRRDEYEDSLAVELIVNPGQFSGNVQKLRIPRTNADSLYRLGQLLQQVTVSSQDKRPEYVTQLIKTIVISNIAPILTPLFNNMGVGEDLGLEYLDALLSNAIPGFIRLGLPGMSLDYLQRRRDFNLRFLLSERIGNKSPSENENRLDDILASLRDDKIIRIGRLLTILPNLECSTIKKIP